MANISYRLGKRLPPGAILEAIRANAELADADDRCRDYLQANGINLAATEAAFGPWVNLDKEQSALWGSLPRGE